MDKQELERRLIDKSIEAFIMGIEIYNKPTIKYRAEGFSFFICNAWELMLKAELLKQDKSIYYKDHPDRTIELGKAVSLIYTDKKQPLRINLEKIIDFRNTSTHFITEDYESIFAPLFQSCVLNYVNELNRFFHKDVSNYVTRSSLTLSTNIHELSNEEIQAKYPAEIANKLIFTKNDINFTNNLENSDRFAITIKHEMFITKKKSDANVVVSIDKKSDKGITIVQKSKDPADTFTLSFDNLVKDVSNRLHKNKIPFTYITKQKTRIKKEFNRYTLNLFLKYFSMKNNPKFAYQHKIGNAVEYTYSQQAAEFIVNQIKQDPHKIIDKIKR